MWSPARTTTVSDGSCSTTFMLRRTASAVPRYHSATRPRDTYGCRSLTPPLLRSRSHGRPRPMWSFSERGLYWVRTTTSWMSELTQFESVKSMIRYLPPNGTAGLARSADRIDRRSPSPPARMIAIVRFAATACLPDALGALFFDASTRFGEGSARALSTLRERGVLRRTPAAGGTDLDEQPRIHEVVVQLDHPVEVRTGRMARAPLVPDDLALLDALPDVDRSLRLHVRVPRAEVPGVGDHHDPRRIRTVGPVPADVDHLATGRRADRRSVRPDEVDPVVEVSASVTRGVILERAAAVLTADGEVVHGPAHRPVELARDVALGHLSADEIFDPRLELLLIGRGAADDRRGVALVARQRGVAGPLLRERPGDLALEDPQLLLGLLETAHGLVEVALLGRRLLPQRVRPHAGFRDGLMDRLEGLLRLGDAVGKRLVLLTDVDVVAHLGEQVGERAA